MLGDLSVSCRRLLVIERRRAVTQQRLDLRSPVPPMPAKRSQSADFALLAHLDTVVLSTWNSAATCLVVSHSSTGAVCSSSRLIGSHS